MSKVTKEPKKQDGEVIESLRSWAVCVACLLINAILFGQGRLSGILLVESVKKFHVTRQEASLPYTGCVTVRHLIGPVVGFLAEKYSVRSVTAVGAVLSTIGIGFCFLANSMMEISILYGLVFGIGYGFGNVLLPVAISQHFSKNRATATGIHFAGSCFGGFLFPPLTDLLIEEYGLNGTFLILSGFVLNCLPLAMILRTPKSPKIHQQIQNNKTTEGPSEDKQLKNFQTTIVVNNLTSSLPKDNNGFLTTEKNSYQDGKRNMQTNFQILSANNKIDVDGFKWGRYTKKNSLPNEVHNVIKDLDHGDEMNSAMTSDEEASKRVSKKKESSLSKTLSIFVDPMFLILATIFAIYGGCFLGLLVVIVDYCRDCGLEDSIIKYVLMIFSIGDLMGRLGLGVLPDRGWISRIHFSALCFLMQGLTIISLAWVSCFPAIVTIMFIYAIFEAGYIAINPLLICEYVGEDKKTIAIPSSNVVTTCFLAAMPAFIGYFREKLGSYTGLFYMFGALLLSCILALYSLPYLQKKRINKNKLGE